MCESYGSNCVEKSTTTELLFFPISALRSYKILVKLPHEIQCLSSLHKQLVQFNWYDGWCLKKQSVHRRVSWVDLLVSKGGKKLESLKVGGSLTSIACVSPLEQFLKLELRAQSSLNCCLHIINNIKWNTLKMLKKILSLFIWTEVIAQDLYRLHLYDNKNPCMSV